MASLAMLGSADRNKLSWRLPRPDPDRELAASAVAMDTVGNDIVWVGNGKTLEMGDCVDPDNITS